MEEKQPTQIEQKVQVIEVPAFFSEEDYHKMIYVTYVNVKELLELVKKEDGIPGQI